MKKLKINNNFFFKWQKQSFKQEKVEYLMLNKIFSVVFSLLYIQI